MSIRTARELLADWYGDELVSNILETDVTVGTAAILLAARDGAVIRRVISNNGAATIFVSSKANVAANTGIPVNSGGTLTFSAIEDADLASCDLFAISVGAGNAVHVVSSQLVGMG